MIQIELTKNFFKIFTKEEKYLFFFLIGSQFITAALELLSIGSLLPIFKAIVDPTWNERYFSFLPENNRIYFIFILVILIFSFKNVCLILIAYFSGKFRNKVTVRIIDLIYSSYLNKKYQFYLENNSAILLRNMQYADGVDSTIMRLVNFYADLILAMMAILVVFFIDFRITLTILIFMTLILFLYSHFTKLKIDKYGLDDINYNTSYLKNMMEGIKSYREILLSGNQSFFSMRNKVYKIQSLRYKLRFQLVEIIPKYLIEFILVFLVIGVAFYFIKDTNLDFNNYLPLLGVLMIGLLKLLPNILRIFSSYQQFKYLIPQVEIVNNSIFQAINEKKFNLDLDKKKEINFKQSIELKDVSFNFNKIKILNNINFKIFKNSFIGIQGESGAGKSTFLNILAGLLTPTSGKILIDGNEFNLSTRYWQNKIGYVSQDTHLVDDTIKANIAFGNDRSKIDEKLIFSCLAKAGLNDYINSLPNKLDTLVGENGVKISGGQAQRIGLARALFNNPEILILDEPTNSLDKDNEIKIIETLKKFKNQITIIIVSHNADPLEIADTKFALKRGELYKIK